MSNRRRTRLSRHTCCERFRAACKALGPERLSNLIIHNGRLTFISHALAGGRTLAVVRDAADHANVSITNGYCTSSTVLKWEICFPLRRPPGKLMAKFHASPGHQRWRTSIDSHIPTWANLLSA